ncbi:hypothetical protein C1J02_08865 [Sulfitobacter sp. SK011]|nr:hypothetical protein C1J02_08865 [Sulfitobacter sp. SK011]
MLGSMGDLAQGVIDAGQQLPIQMHINSLMPLCCARSGGSSASAADNPGHLAVSPDHFGD